MEDLRSSVDHDEITQYKQTGAGESFKSPVKHKAYDQQVDEIEFEVEEECAKEEVIISVEGNTSSEEFECAERDVEEEEEAVRLRPMRNGNRESRAGAIQALGFPPEEDEWRPWWDPKEKPWTTVHGLTVARGPQSTAIRRFQNRLKKWLGLE